MRYCEHAKKLTGKKTLCGKDCTFYQECPGVIIQDTGDLLSEKIMKIWVKSILESRHKKPQDIEEWEKK